MNISVIAMYCDVPGPFLLPPIRIGSASLVISSLEDSVPACWEHKVQRSEHGMKIAREMWT